MKLYLLILKYTINKAYKHSDKIVSVKEGDLDYICKHYNILDETKLEYIPNGYDLENIEKPVKCYDEIINTKKFKVIYAGAMSSYYTLEELIKVAQLTNEKKMNIDYILVGDGINYEKYKSISKNLKNVHFTGNISKSNVNYLLKNSDVAYLPLVENKFNKHGISTNKLYDYMYYKLPIIGFYKSKYDIIKKHKFGIVIENYNVEELFNAIEKLFKLNKKELKKLGENGYTLLHSDYTFKTIAEKYHKILN